MGENRLQENRVVAISQQQKGNAMRTLRFKVSGQELIRATGCNFGNIIAGTSGCPQTAFDFYPAIVYGGGVDYDD